MTAPFLKALILLGSKKIEKIFIFRQPSILNLQHYG